MQAPLKAAPRPGSVPLAECPRRELHTPCPSGYVAWHEWAYEMGKTHRTKRCPGCNLFAVWVPK